MIKGSHLSEAKGRTHWDGYWQTGYNYYILVFRLMVRNLSSELAFGAVLTVRYNNFSA